MACYLLFMLSFQDFSPNPFHLSFFRHRKVHRNESKNNPQGETETERDEKNPA